MKKADHEQLVGRTIAGKYVVESLIGTGAMGAVFKAHQTALDKTVAIKVMHGEHAGDPAFAGRFHREAKAASRLNHPNSIQILDFGAEPDGLLYIAMEFLGGKSLHALLREEWPLPASRIADIAMQVLAALAIAHDTGVVHRDLKPENIMVLSGTDDDGRHRDSVKVCDFGIAKITDPRAYRAQTGEHQSQAPVTTAGFLVGTPEYMSPEQGRGDALDPRADLYSVGVILYEMLTKRVPFDAENAIGIVLKHITEEPARPSTLAPGVDPRLEAITLRALRKFREERYANAREMRAELRNVVDGAIPMTPPPSSVELAAAVASPALANADTVAMPVPPTSSYSGAKTPSYGGAKPTLEGTTAASVEGKPGRKRGLFVASVVFLAGVAVMTGRALLSPSHAAPATTSTSEPAPSAAVPTKAPVSEPPAPAAPTAAAPTGPVTPAAPALESEPAPPTHGAAAHAGHAKGAAPVTPAAKVSAATLAPPPASALAAGPASPPPAIDTAAASSASPADTSSASAPAQAPFDPSQAYVDVGMINAQGVKEPAVRQAVKSAPLAQCYKTALKAKGASAPGVATLSLAFDDKGAVKSAALNGADFLPDVTKCVQDAGAALKLGPGQVESGGGSADVTLGFRQP